MKKVNVQLKQIVTINYVLTVWCRNIYWGRKNFLPWLSPAVMCTLAGSRRLSVSTSPAIFCVLSVQEPSHFIWTLKKTEQPRKIQLTTCQYSLREFYNVRLPSILLFFVHSNYFNIRGNILYIVCLQHPNVLHCYITILHIFLVVCY